MVIAWVLGLVMTWTVESKTSVEASGDVPSNAVTEYWNTNGKGTVRQGDTATLVISQIRGLQIQKIEYMLQSNKSSGEGIIAVYADDELLVRKTGTYKDWCGKYDNETDHSVVAWSGQRTITSELCMQLIGVTNSLYLSQLVITYQPAQPYSVALMVGHEEYGTLTETTGGAGVELPTVEDRDYWHFLGWATNDSWQVGNLPDTWYRAGTRVYPTGNTTLWSLWQYAEVKEPEYVTELEDGDYIYLHREDLNAASGVPNNGKLGTSIANVEDEQQIYHIAFNETKDSATIQHKATGKYIGYKCAKTPTIKEQASMWAVWHGGDATIFYFTNTTDNKIRVLWPGCTKDYETYYTDLLKTNDVTNTPTVLLSTEIEKTDPIYTGHPECKLGTGFVLPSDEEIVVPFGIYELHIWKGKKYLRLRR